MARTSLEKRVAHLEAELAEFKARINGKRNDNSWIKDIYGAFANDPAYDEAMRLGREYRESLRPISTPKAGAKKRNVHTRHGSGQPARKRKQ
jgi:hypothetical protein